MWKPASYSMTYGRASMVADSVAPAAGIQPASSTRRRAVSRPMSIAARSPRDMARIPSGASHAVLRKRRVKRERSVSWRDFAGRKDAISPLRSHSNHATHDSRPPTTTDAATSDAPPSTNPPKALHSRVRSSHAAAVAPSWGFAHSHPSTIPAARGRPLRSRRTPAAMGTSHMPPGWPVTRAMIE